MSGTRSDPKQQSLLASTRLIITALLKQSREKTLHAHKYMQFWASAPAWAQTLSASQSASLPCHQWVQVIDAIAKERNLNRPSVSYGAENLYMHGPLEELTKQNLSKVWQHLPHMA